MPPSQRRSSPFYALAALILLALPAGWYVFLRGSTPPAPAPTSIGVAPAEDGHVDVRISGAEGAVELRQADGSWVKAAEGEVLDPDGAVRTLDGAAAVLSAGELWQVRMESGTEVSLGEVSESTSRVLLSAGMATATVRDAASKHTFEVRASGSDAVAKTAGGTFAISNNAAGTVAVGAREGEVEFSGAGRMVIVRAGQQSIVHPGGAPTEPSAVPSSLLLKVKWPQKSLLTRRRLVVSGETAPGAQVQVAGRVVRAGADGRFSHPVQLAEGRNAINVTAVEVGGSRASTDADLQVDTRDPSIGIDRDVWTRE